MLTADSIHLRDVGTPALVVDKAALQANISRMAGRAKAAGMSLRPHAKTHKSVEIGRMQRAAGAVGIACATIGEAEALSAAGLRDILITAPTMRADKFARIAQLNRTAGVALVVDHLQQLAGVAAALASGDPVLDVLIDVDVGQARTGITDTGAGLELAQAISADARLRFAGIQGFGGHVQHVVGLAERKASAAQAAGVLRAFAHALQQAGMAPRIITGSGTGSYSFDAAGPYNELQVGSYLFMDADYARLDDEGGDLAFQPSLFVLATVVSANRPGQVTVDAGTKALATNGPTPSYFIGVPTGANYRFAGDEHGVLTFADGGQPVSLGTRVLIGATHCDPTVNLHGLLHAVDSSGVERWQVLGRYP